ncbi:MAG: type IV pilus assembly protein PilW [Paraglaciecola sp.]|jgi:type IV pilus assembly protein PilW
MKKLSKHNGFTLIEVMISLTLGLIISGAIVQVMISNGVTDRLNRAMASAQESGRFVISRLRTDMLVAGRYDSLSPLLNTSVDIVAEASFVQNHPIPLPGDFVNDASVGAIQGLAGGNDTLVVNFQGDRDCRGYKLGYDADEEFFVVNQYFVDGNQLKCRGFDGRVLRGLRAAVGNDSDKAYTILDDIYSFQVQYGITNTIASGDSSARPVQYITADAIAAAIAAGSQVVSLRIGILVKGDADVVVEPVPSFKVLNEVAIQPTEKRYFKQFNTTIALRNVKNFMRNIKR